MIFAGSRYKGNERLQELLSRINEGNRFHSRRNGRITLFNSAFGFEPKRDRDSGALRNGDEKRIKIQFRNSEGEEEETG